MNDSVGFFKTITKKKLSNIIIAIEFNCIAVAVLGYLTDPSFLFTLLPMFSVFNFLTLLPFPTVFRELKKKSHVNEFENKQKEDAIEEGLGIWERATIGFYIVANSALLIFILTQLGYIDFRM